ncbi:ABC transporter substrate-binding protein [Nitrospinota bacterium]
MRLRCWVALLLALLISAAGTVSAAPKGKIVIGISNEPTTFDPHVITGFPQTVALTNVFDTLLFRKHDGTIIPHLAKSWRLVNPKVWEFKLRKGVKFTNGEPMDAAAVKFSMERVLDPKLKSRQFGYFRSVARVEAVDRYTVRIHNKYPDMTLTSALTNYPVIVPPKYYKSHDLKYVARHPIGSGPYRLVKWSKGDRLVYEANENYWKPGVPSIKNVVVKSITEPTTRVAALLAGDVSIVDNVPPPADSSGQVQPRPRCHRRAFPDCLLREHDHQG